MLIPSFIINSFNQLNDNCSSLLMVAFLTHSIVPNFLVGFTIAGSTTNFLMDPYKYKYQIIVITLYNSLITLLKI